MPAKRSIKRTELLVGAGLFLREPLPPPALDNGGHFMFGACVISPILPDAI